MADKENKELVRLFKSLDGTPLLNLQHRLTENKDITSPIIPASEFENEFFKVTELKPGYYGAVARKTIPKDTIILVEAPLLAGVSPATFIRDQSFMSQQDVRQLWAVIEKGGRENSSKSGADRYPPKVAAAIDNLIELYASRRVAPTLDEHVKTRIMALQDSFRKPLIGAVVRIEGLTSTAGQALNGLDGVVASVSGDRFGVDVEGISDRKAMKAQNLKTLGGIIRTNMFEEGLYAVITRFNHACSEARNLRKKEVVGIDPQVPTQTHSVLSATTCIEQGQELFIDYMIEESAALGVTERRRNLQLKYGFTCECAKCVAEAQAALLGSLPHTQGETVLVNGENMGFSQIYELFAKRSDQWFDVEMMAGLPMTARHPRVAGCCSCGSKTADKYAMTATQTFECISCGVKAFMAQKRGRA